MVKFSVLLPVVLSVLLMILASVFTLFSGKIDRAVKGEKMVQKVILVFSMGVVLIGMITIMASVLS